MVGQCWSNAAQARRAPTTDRELPQFAEPDGRPALRPRGRTHRTDDPARPCAAPSLNLSVDSRFTSTESRFAPLLKVVLQQNRGGIADMAISCWLYPVASDPLCRPRRIGALRLWRKSQYF